VAVDTQLDGVVATMAHLKNLAFNTSGVVAFS